MTFLEVLSRLAGAYLRVTEFEKPLCRHGFDERVERTKRTISSLGSGRSTGRWPRIGQPHFLHFFSKGGARHRTAGDGNFAFPFGDVTLNAKRKIDQDVTSCRSIFNGLNGPEIDLNLLRANSLYGDQEKVGSVRVSDTAGAVCGHMENALVHCAGDVESLTKHVTMLDQDRELLGKLRAGFLST